MPDRPAPTISTSKCSDFVMSFLEVDAKPAFDLLVQIPGEIFRRAGGGDRAEAQHINPRGHAYNPPDVMVDQEDGDPEAGEQPYMAEDVLDHFRRQAD